MFALLRQVTVSLLGLTLITGILYPLVVTGIAQVVFPYRANGSMMLRHGRAIGSEWIGQSFTDPTYFWSRPSATSPVPYNGAASSGTNYGPLNPSLHAMVQARLKALRAADPGNRAPVPVDLVTASASGLDPHISPATAAYQAARVARLRSLDEAVVQALIAEHTTDRVLGVLGEPAVHVLKLNLALDALSR
jgi:K+-transporting ATPase ATPase C chain